MTRWRGWTLPTSLAVFLDEMSTGEVRRVLVARALVTTPVALILDEPATGLDSVARHRLVTLMNRVAESGTTLIWSRIKSNTSSRPHVVLLKQGRVYAAGPRDQMLTSERLSALFDKQDD